MANMFLAITQTTKSTYTTSESLSDGGLDIFKPWTTNKIEITSNKNIIITEFSLHKAVLKFPHEDKA
ncbi:MAG: hypothetical protein IPN43_02555 [Chitinophagaceae bacterium]|nr:hypothetical protein [Chitinophagaceae bacterium]